MWELSYEGLDILETLHLMMQDFLNIFALLALLGLAEAKHCSWSKFFFLPI